MKNFYLLFIGLFVAMATGHAQSISSGNTEIVYPGDPSYYSFTFSGSIVKKWVVQGGSFSINFKRYGNQPFGIKCYCLLGKIRFMFQCMKK